MLQRQTLGVEKQTITQALLTQLRDDILSGVIGPGTRLRQQDVAARFNVSTTPVREAFSGLQREGLVTATAHRGVVVFTPTVESLQKTYEIRVALESLAIRKAAEEITDRQLAEVRRTLTKMSRVMDQRVQYHLLNCQFHDGIYAAADNPKLSDLIRQLRDSVNAYILLFGKLAESADDVHQDHVEILEALEARDGARAERVLVKHLARPVRFVSPRLPHGAEDQADGFGDSSEILVEVEGRAGRQPAAAGALDS